tara:strand:+ start:189 stop:479 length:291 start_codon:yes stop_codon:yes gene_type:complete
MSFLNVILLLGVVVLAATVGILVWYIRANLRFMRTIQTNLTGTSVLIQEYQEHLDRIANMETYYGDNVVEGLMTHTREMAQLIQLNVDEIRSYFDE